MCPRPRLTLQSVLRRRHGGAARTFPGRPCGDYQLLVNVSEREALERSRAPYFLWLAGGAALKPQTLEECAWGLQDADWVTWLDTGTAPPPSLRRCAGPLGVSRRVLEQPESKRSGRVRRLPWKCPRGPGRAAAAPRPVRPPALRSSPPPAGSIALRVKERLNALAGRPLFDLGPYLASRPRAGADRGPARRAPGLRASAKGAAQAPRHLHPELRGRRAR